MSEISYDAIIICPVCGYSHNEPVAKEPVAKRQQARDRPYWLMAIPYWLLETMPSDSCLVLYKCRKCGFVMKPKEGGCCVFCSYADKKCPPMQLN